MKVIFNYKLIQRQQDENLNSSPIGYLYENEESFPNLVVNQLWNDQDKGILVNNKQPLHELIDEPKYNKVINELDDLMIYGHSESMELKI